MDAGVGAYHSDPEHDERKRTVPGNIRHWSSELRDSAATRKLQRSSTNTCRTCFCPKSTYCYGSGKEELLVADIGDEGTRV